MTSSDLYAYLSTFSLVIVSCFACWALYYLVQILKRIYRFLDAIEDSFKNASNSLESIINRFSTMRDSLQMLAQGMHAASSMYQKIKKSRKRKKPLSEAEDFSEK